jgi:AMMECR1 domain-containing protein
MQVPIWFDYLSIFIDAGEILVMVDDIATPSNPLVTPVEHEELKKVSFDVNVFQRPREEELSR